MVSKDSNESGSAIPFWAEAALHPLSLSRALWKQKAVTIFVAVVAAATAVAGVMLWPSTYQAEATILVEGQRIPTEFVSPTVSTDLRDQLSSLQQRVLSHTQLLSLVDKYGLYPDFPRDQEEELAGEMRKEIWVELDRGWSTRGQPAAFRVGYSSGDPNLAAQVANDLAGLFINENYRTREIQAAGTSQFLDKQLEGARTSLEQQEALLSRYKMQNVGELPEQEQALSNSLARLDARLRSIRDSLSEARQEKTVLEGSRQTIRSSQTIFAAVEESANVDMPNATPPPLAPVGAELEEDPEAVLKDLLERYTEDHPAVKRERARLAAEEQQARARPAERQSPTVAPLAPRQHRRAARVQNPAIVLQNQRLAEIESQLAVVQERMKALQAEEPRIIVEMQDIESRVRRLPMREQELAALVRDYEISKANYQSLLRKKMDADISADMEHRQKAEKFTLLESARVPVKPAKPQRLFLSFLGCGIALVLGAMAGLGRETHKNVLLGEWELPKDVPVLSHVPFFEIPSDTQGASTAEHAAGT